MNVTKLHILLCFILTSLITVAQDSKDYYGLEKEDTTSRFSYGFNIGGYFANAKSAIIYNGSPSSTIYGINYIFNQPFNRQTFDNYFQFPYEIAEYPIESRYQTSIELGVHVNYRISRLISVYAELNAVLLDYENFFTVAIDDPNNRTPGPDFQQLPIIGEERRFNLNIGTQVSYYEQNGTKAYLSFFGNMNDTEMQRNFIIVDNVNYEIFHQTDNNLDPRPGGIGYGLGGGTGLKFHFTDRIVGDLYYNLYYTEAYFTEDFQPTGYNHSIGIRLLWN